MGIQTLLNAVIDGPARGSPGNMLLNPVLHGPNASCRRPRVLDCENLLQG